MRSILACFAISILLSGCAAQGVIVEKRSRLRPDSSIIGTEGVNSFAFRGPTGPLHPPVTTNPQYWADTGGSCKLILRDQQGHVRSQLVTPEIFARYNVGDYFNDLLPPVEAKDPKDSTTKPVVHHQRHTERQNQMAQKRRTHHKVAKHHHRMKRQKAIARRASSMLRQG